jgi:LacI family transcriptional regulator
MGGTGNRQDGGAVAADAHEQPEVEAVVVGGDGAGPAGGERDRETPAPPTPYLVATLRDVARRAGVHPATASRALNPATRSVVSDETASRVLDAAREIGYQPNPMARGLKTNRSSTIGVLIPDLTNPLFPPIVRGIEDTIGAAGFTAILANSDNHHEKERLLFENMRARQVEGFIMATAERDHPLIEDAIAADVPIVLLNRTVESQKAFAVVGNDRAGAALAANHLAELGHRAIAHLVGPSKFSTALARYQGFVDTMTLRDLPVDRQLMRFGNAFTEEEGLRLFNELLGTGAEFTAIFAGNDLLAIGCYDGLREHSLRCPDDVSIVGYNDIPFLDKLNPPLTSIRLPHYEIGVEAGKLLLERIGDPSARARTTLLEPELIVRGSTAPPGYPVAGRAR